jgi:endonuclease/exonuclease/phosphatase family metal-dependent hydrolase
MSDGLDNQPDCSAASVGGSNPAAPRTLRIATFNVENYLDDTAPKGGSKSAESKAEVRRSICAINPDVPALQEMGSLDTLMELRDSLGAEGCEFPHWEHIGGCDADIHLAILSKFPFAARRPHNDESFLLHGRWFGVRRGFGDVDIQVAPGYAFTLITAHLKSANRIPDADEAELRLAEARLLREKIDARLAVAPETRLLVLGDFNDTQDSAVIRTLIGQDPHRLVSCPVGPEDGAVVFLILVVPSAVRW